MCINGLLVKMIDKMRGMPTSPGMQKRSKTTATA